MNAANNKQAWRIHERCKVCHYAPEQDVEPIDKLHHQCINNTERLPHKPNDSARLGCRLGWILVLLNTAVPYLGLHTGITHERERRGKCYPR